MNESELIIKIGRHYNDAMAAINEEEGNYRKIIQRKRDLIEEERVTRLSLLDITLPSDWHENILKAVKAECRRNSVNLFGSIRFSGHVLLAQNEPNGLKQSCRFTSVYDIRNAIYTIKNNIPAADIFKHGEPNISQHAIAEKLANPEVPSISITIERDIPDCAAENFRLTEYRLTLINNKNCLEFYIDAYFQPISRIDN